MKKCEELGVEINTSMKIDSVEMSPDGQIGSVHYRSSHGAK